MDGVSEKVMDNVILCRRAGGTDLYGGEKRMLSLRGGAAVSLVRLTLRSCCRTPLFHFMMFYSNHPALSFYGNRILIKYNAVAVCSASMYAVGTQRDK